jgi:hypothetical protein
MPPYEAARIARSSGLMPVARPVRWGSSYVVPAMDRAGTPVRVVIDGRSGAILGVRRVAAAPPTNYPYPYPDARPGFRPYPPPGAWRERPYDDWPGATDARTNPGPVPGATVPGRPAALKPARPPIPRARPSAAPVQAAHAQPAEAAPSAPAAAADTKAATGAADTTGKPAAAFPPVQSLE